LGLRSEAAVAALLLAACDPGIQLGDSCVRTSECPAGLACVIGRCREECTVHADCAFDAECVRVDGVGVCRLPSDTCADGRTCDPPLLCAADGQCRPACTSDDDCTPGSTCTLVDDRLLCVRRETIDAGTDGGARDAGPTTSCPGSTNLGFVDGLQSWCFEASDGDPLAHARVVSAGFDGASLEIDLDGAPDGTWVRAYQEVPLDESLTHVFFLETAPELGSAGSVVYALDAIGDGGVVLARTGSGAGALGMAACDATGRTGSRCQTIPAASQNVALPVHRWLGFADVDLRQVRTIRRTIEAIAGSAGPARVVLDGVSADPPDCPSVFWRGSGDLVEETFDRPWSSLGASLRWAGDTTAAVRTFSETVCGGALRLEGGRWIEHDPLMLSSGMPITIELFWHPPPGDVGAERQAILWQGIGDFGIEIVGRRLRAVAALCGGDADDPGIVVEDSVPLGGVADRFLQEIEVSFLPTADFASTVLCLGRNGHLVGCTTGVRPGCMPAMPYMGPLRIGHGRTGVHAPFRGAIDELRIRRGDHAPSATGATGRCYVDRVCSDHARSEVRDVGSRACVPASACSSLSPCPDDARDATRACAAGTRPTCRFEPSGTACFFHAVDCTTSTCTRPEACADEILLAGCP
jgi:hypothetical protein